MTTTLGRTVTALVTFEDEDLGRLGPFAVPSPWWADVEPVAAYIRKAIGVNVVVVRIIDVENGRSARDGHVTYHVEALDHPSRGLDTRAPDPTAPETTAPETTALDPTALDPTALDPTALGTIALRTTALDPTALGTIALRTTALGTTALSTGALKPGTLPAFLRIPVAQRASWATPSGIRSALAWAATSLDELGSERSVGDTVEQIKTWNLSGLFRIPTTTGAPVWLKMTPAFGAHEPAVTALIGGVDPLLVPTVLASDPEHRRALLAHVPGEDCWNASPQLIRSTLTRWVAAQAAIARRPPPSTDVVPDRQPRLLVEGLSRLLAGEAGADLRIDEMAAAQRLLQALPDLIDQLEACGLPNTLVHGDFHPGNWRSGGVQPEDGAAVLVDFADAYFGHPAFDGERLRDFIDEARQPAVVEAWCDAWTEHVPASDPRRALDLARPLQAISGAILYQTFLDHIEPSERRYHEGDPAAGIRVALAAAV